MAAAAEEKKSLSLPVMWSHVLFNTRENGDAFPRNDEGWEDVWWCGRKSVCICLEGEQAMVREEEGKSEREPFRYGRMRSSRPARQRYVCARERETWLGLPLLFHPSWESTTTKTTTHSHEKAACLVSFCIDALKEGANNRFLYIFLLFPLATLASDTCNPDPFAVDAPSGFFFPFLFFNDHHSRL